MNPILFVRHAQTDSAGTFCGQSDPPLNPAGHDQLQPLRAAFQTRPLDAIYTSPLTRARQTAEALATPRNLPLIAHPGLKEIHFGAWEGLTWDEISRRDPVDAQSWLDHFPHLPAPGGEPFADFRDRTLQTLAELTTLARESRLAVVTHAGVLRLLLTHLCGESDASAWQLTKPFCCAFDYTPETHHVLHHQNHAFHRVVHA